MSRPVDIVALGACTPVGLRADATAAALRAGITGMRELPFVSRAGAPIVGAKVPTLAPDAVGGDRMHALQTHALSDLLRTVQPESTRCRLWHAIGEPRPGFDGEDAKALGRDAIGQLHDAGFDVLGRKAFEGHAGGLQALASVLADDDDACVHVVLGVDSWMHPKTYTWLETRGLLAQANARNGVVPGEAAVALLLARRSMQAALRLPPKVRVVGSAHAQERRGRDSETGSFGEALTAAVLQAGAALSFPDQAADNVFSDVNGERYRSEEWAFLAMKAGRSMRALQYLSPVGSVGDVGAAFGPLGCLIACEASTRRYAKGPISLITAGSHHGSRAATFLQDVAR